MKFYEDPAYWLWVIAVILMIASIVGYVIIRWKSYDHGEPINWEPDAELPHTRELQPFDLTPEETFASLMDTLAEKAQVRIENLVLEARVHALETELARQTMLKRRYWRALKRAGLR